MTDQLPAIIPPGVLAPLGEKHLVPALIANEGEQAGWRRRVKMINRSNRSRAHGPTILRTRAGDRCIEWTVEGSVAHQALARQPVNP